MANKSLPKVLGKKVAAGKAANARLGMKSRMGNIRSNAMPAVAGLAKKQAAKKKKKQKTRTQRGEAPKVVANSGRKRRVRIPGRNTPSDLRYKTGYWRPVKQSWMNDTVWEAIKGLHKMRRDALSKEAHKFAKGDRIYGKEGPGHRGYGTGAIQSWADKMTKKGVDPHYVNMLDWFVDSARSFNGLNGGDFDELWNQAKSDPNHFFIEVYNLMKQNIKGAENLSSDDFKEMMRHNFYDLQYGPDGRAK